jgi:hypothetical protein
MAKFGGEAVPTVHTSCGLPGDPSMLRNMLSRRTFLSFAALVLAGSRVQADDKTDKLTLSGSWGKKDSEPTLKFTREGGLTIHPHGDDNAILIECSYTLSKEGLVKVKVKNIDAPEKVIEQVKNVISIGQEFEFHWKADGDKATLEGIEGKDVDPIKDRLEGGYSKK